MTQTVPLVYRLQVTDAVSEGAGFILPGMQMSATCAHCGIASAHRLSGRVTVSPEWVEGANAGGDTVQVQTWTCTFCGQTTTILVEFPEENEKEPSAIHQVWPERAPRELPEEAPPQVRSLYREASQAENAEALRGAAILYRATVEALVKDQGATGDNLEKRIDALASKGVSSDLVLDLHEARLTGNWSIHEGTSFSVAEVADVAELIRQAVEELYVLPAQKAAMREARAKRRGERREGEED